MASQLLALLAASGLVTAGAGAVPATRAADAMPAKAALVTPISAKAPVGACFLPMKDGKVAKLGDFRKAKAAGQCADLNPKLAQGGGFLGVPGNAWPIVGLTTAAALGVGIAMICSNKTSGSGC